MSKAITGAALLGAAVAIGAIAAELASGGTASIVLLAALEHVSVGVGLAGLSMEAGAIASALTSNRGMGITTRQAAAYRQVILGGDLRVGGISIYESTTGSSHDQYNYVIVFSGHEIDSITNLWLDGRQVYWQGSGVGWQVRNGIGFGGVANGSTYTGPDGQQYNFGGTGHSGIYAEARYGDQLPGDVIGGLTANDGNWAADGSGNSPWVAGCTYIYLKIEYNQTVFPNPPEIKVAVRGKNNIWDPRTGTRGWTSNPALLVADQILDTQFGLGDVEAFQDAGSLAQLVAAANICDEAILVEALSATTPTYESQYSAHYHYDTATAAGNVIDLLLSAMGGRISQPGGEWYIYPAAWLGASFGFDESIIAGPIKFEPYRAQKDLCNRVAGTYTAANFPWNIAGNLYNQNGFYNGSIQNNFPLADQPTDYPQYAADPQHGYAVDQYLDEDSGLIGPWSNTTTYNWGDVVSIGTGMSMVRYKSIVASNLGNNPAATGSTDWMIYSNLLPKQLNLAAVQSVTQAQRLAKIELLRNRFGFSGDFPVMQRAFAMQAVDVMELTFPAMGWIDMTLELTGVKSSRTDPGDGEAPLDCLDFHLEQTDPSIYEWNPELEELTVYDVAATPTQQSLVPAPPTGMTLTSGAATAVIALDGNVTPRVEVQWDTPADILATMIQVQYQSQPISGTPGPWITAGFADITENSFYVSGVVAGQQYGFRIASIRGGNGAASVWVEIDGYTVSITLSTLGQLALSPASLSAVAYPAVSFTGTTASASTVVSSVSSTTGLVEGMPVFGSGIPLGARIAGIGSGTITLSIAASASASAVPLTAAAADTITVSPFTAKVGAASVVVLGAPFVLYGEAPSELYFVYYSDPTFTGGAVTPIATTNNSDYLGKVGYFLIGSILTPATGSTGTPTGLPTGGGGSTSYVFTSYSDIGESPTSDPSGPYTSGTAVLTAPAGACSWQGVSGTTTTATTLSVEAGFTSGGFSATQFIGYSLDGGSTYTYWYSGTGGASSAFYTVSIPSGTDLTLLRVVAGCGGYEGSGSVQVSNFIIG